MRSSLILFLLIPTFIALGHDVYLFYTNYLNPGVFSFDLLQKEFKFSSLGYIWTTYGRESFDATVMATEGTYWPIIDKILTLRATVAGLIFAGFFLILFLILKMFGRGPFVEEGTVSKKKSSDSFRSGKQSGKIKYKRQ